LCTKQEDEQTRLSNAEAQVRRWQREIKCRQEEILAVQREISSLEERKKELACKIGQLEKQRRTQEYFLLTAKQSLLNELGAISHEMKVPEHLRAMWRKHQKVLGLN
jgi:predicted  nucleic acid-binding Zn-ribbon protein